jgi:ligand-binding sensor domain-containing protein
VPFLSEHALMAVAPDGRIWFAADDQSGLTSYDPRGGRLELVETGLNGVAAIAFDASSRLWFTDGDRALSFYDLRTAHLERSKLVAKGAARVLLPDPSGVVWVGTTAGEVIAVRDWVQSLAFTASRPIGALALDKKGVAWYLTPPQQERGGFVYGRVGDAERFTVPGPVASLAFTADGRAWLADPAGGFYLSLERVQ